MFIGFRDRGKEGGREEGGIEGRGGGGRGREREREIGCFLDIRGPDNEPTNFWYGMTLQSTEPPGQGGNRLFECNN